MASGAAGAERPRQESGPPAAPPHPPAWMGGRYGARLTKPQRRRLLARLLELDGPYCRYRGCPTWGVPEDADAGAGLGRLLNRFEVNHVAGPVDHWLDMTELMHADCNKRARYDPAEADRAARARAELAGRAAASARLEREKTGAPAPPAADATERLHASVDYGAGSPEMQVNDEAEPVWLNWLCAVLKLVGWATKYEAINTGSNACGANPTATRKYYERRVWVPSKMTGDHPELPFEEFTADFRGADGERHRGKLVRVRPGWELAHEAGEGGMAGRLRPRRLGA